MIYSDPPYLQHTRTSGRRYRFDYQERDHIERIERLKSLPCQVMVSGDPSALYDKLLGDWRHL
jgi:DNA adenine methylase